MCGAVAQARATVDAVLRAPRPLSEADGRRTAHGLTGRLCSLPVNALVCVSPVLDEMPDTSPEAREHLASASPVTSPTTLGTPSSYFRESRETARSPPPSVKTP